MRVPFQEDGAAKIRGRKRTAAGRSSTGILPRPMLVGAPRNALRAFNAGVSLSCLRVLAHRLPHLFYGLVSVAPPLQGPRPAGLKRRHGAPADRLNADRSYPSALCCPGAFFVKVPKGAAWKGGNTQRPALGQFRSKPRIAIMSFVSSRRRRSSST